MTAPAGLQGIDVAWLQGAIDWRAVAAAGVAFAYVRSGEAAWLEGDTACARNLMGAADAGVVSGVYHVHHTGSGAAAQARLVRRRHPDFVAGRSLPPAIDFEWIDKRPCTPADVVACEELAAAIADAFGVAPVLYTNAGYVGRLVAASSPLASLDVWLAHYGVDAPRIPQPWASWRIWQWVGNGGRVQGVSVDCDRNVFNGDRAAFDAWVASYGPSRVGPAEPPRADAVTAPVQLSVLDAAADWSDET